MKLKNNNQNSVLVFFLIRVRNLKHQTFKRDHDLTLGSFNRI